MLVIGLSVKTCYLKPSSNRARLASLFFCVVRGGRFAKEAKITVDASVEGLREGLIVPSQAAILWRPYGWA